MINRREFLKGMIGAGISGIIPAPFLSDRTFNAEDRKQPPAPVEYEEVPKGRRIYYLADNMELYMKIYRCASGIDCEIFHLNPYSADMMSLNGFIYIIDRNLVGKEWWGHYVRCCNKYNWIEPCLIVDNVKDMKMPQSNYVEQFDLNDPSSISSILYIIKEARVQNVLRKSSGL
jgi:hypothetical protein